MQLLLATDIFGMTPELHEMVSALTSVAAGVVIVDPYRGEFFDFKNEDEAYAHFQEHVGSDRYARDVLAAVKPVTGPLLIVGFSVGAAAVWEVAATIGAHDDIKALCFYGSRIRNRQGLEPAIAVEMVFPREEPHFDVTRLCRTLGLKHRVFCRQTNYLHGFMNPRSKNFDPQGYERYLQIIKLRLVTS